MNKKVACQVFGAFHEAGAPQVAALEEPQRTAWAVARTPWRFGGCQRSVNCAGTDWIACGVSTGDAERRPASLATSISCASGLLYTANEPVETILFFALQFHNHRPPF